MTTVAEIEFAMIFGVHHTKVGTILLAALVGIFNSVPKFYKFKL